MTDTNSPTEEELKNMDNKTFRREHPSGLMKLFSLPDVEYTLDALLDLPPNATITTSELANRAGLPTDTIDEQLDTLTTLGILMPENTDSDPEYSFNTNTPVGKALVKLSTGANAMALNDNQMMLDHLDKLPDTEFTYHCPNCGARGAYQGETLTGHVLTCPNDNTDWTLPADNPPGSVIRLETALTDQTTLNSLKEKAETDGEEALTEHEQALIECEFNTDTPDPLFTNNRTDSEPE